MPGVPPARYAYLGPEGTFTEAALRTLPAAAIAELEPCVNVPAALDVVRRGDADGAVVPIENSVEGAVTVTLDELASGEPLMITREIVIPVAFTLMARAGTSLADCKRVLTHPHASAQCRTWIQANLPQAEVMMASSTAAAAAEVAESGTYDAAIAPKLAAERYQLSVLADGIGDVPDAVTRFVLVARPDRPAAPTGADKTSVVAYIRDDHPGALLEILDEFAVRGINLSRIESRPTGVGIGRYCFSIDCEGHVTDARVREALMGLRRVCGDVRFLGSYPRADGVRPTLRHGTTDPDFTDAEAWIARITEGRIG